MGDFEVRTVQNVKIPGYVDPFRQKNVVKFTQAFGSALDKLKSELSSDYKVTVNGVWGSNGGHAASKAIPTLNHNPVDKGILIDARAWEGDAKKLYQAMNGNLAIINTSGDAPAPEGMIADHGTAKALKKALPGLKVYWVDSQKGLNVFVAHHLKSMHWDTSFEVVKEFTGDGYANLGKMTGEDLRNQILTGNREGKEELGGVYIDPEPTHVGKDKSDLKKKVLESRPSGDATSWPIEIPQELKR